MKRAGRPRRTRGRHKLCHVTKKTRYEDQNQALHIIWHIQHATRPLANPEAHEPLPLRAYFCTGCQGYHLTRAEFDPARNSSADNWAPPTRRGRRPAGSSRRRLRKRQDADDPDDFESRCA